MWGERSEGILTGREELPLLAKEVQGNLQVEILSPNHVSPMPTPSLLVPLL